jgi:hypothetical protein
MDELETLAARKVAGQKAAFAADPAGTCRNRGGDADAIAQSVQLVRQIYDIVPVPNLDTVWISCESGIFAARRSEQGVIGLVLGSDGNVPAARAALQESAGPVAAGSQAGAGKELMPQIRKITTEYLTDFAETALMVQIKQSGLDVSSPQPEQLSRLIAGLEKAAVMIVGPGRSKEMAEKLRKTL